MAFDAAAMLGLDATMSGVSASAGGNAYAAVPNRVITDQSQHVDGMDNGSTAASSDIGTRAVRTGAAYVFVALALLWLMGSLAFRTSRL